jgi:universal stress protein E
MPQRRVLFAIRDPAARTQPGLLKAVQVARALGASLELFHALTDTVIVAPGPYEYDAVDSLRERIEEQARVPLARHCAVARKHGVDAASSVEWDRPAHEAIMKRAQAIGAELIIAECHPGARHRPWLLHLTEWELLRNSPLPVLLLKNPKPYRRPRLLAAVDPAHAHGKPLALDARILTVAGELGQALRGSLHVMHANYPSIVGPDVRAAASKAASAWATLSFEELKNLERQAFEEFRTSAGIPRTRAHLVEGNPAAAIPKLAKKLDAAIVAMGAISRSALERMFIGNTAERLLGELPCDVLVIKPAKAAK